MRGLTAMQQRFVEQYVTEPNAAKAARLAGYQDLRSAMEGWRLLKNPQVKIAIEHARRAEREDR